MPINRIIFWGTLVMIQNSIELYGQTKRVITTYPNSNYVREIYFVMESNESVKQGPYYLFHSNQFRKPKSFENLYEDDFPGSKEKGGYKNNLRDGEWIFSNFNSISEKGSYINGNKVGIWKTYFEHGQVVKKFDYSKDSSLDTEVRLMVKYPLEAMKKGVMGTVKVVIVSDREPPAYKIIEDIGYGCGNALVNALKVKRAMERKYGLVDKDVQVGSDTLTVKFKLDE